MDVAAWLRGLGLERYEPTFRQNEIDWDVLPELTESDLEKLGLPLGPRKKLLKAIAALSTEATAVALEAVPSPGIITREAERRQLTVLFCDLVGSTELSARLDPEDLREVIGRYQDACAEVVGRFEGHIARFLGDGALAYFGWPRAHEHAAERAVRAGLALVEVIAQLEPGMQARVGIATGSVVAGDLIGRKSADLDSVIGETPNLAARLQMLAEPGTVVIGEATRRLVGGLFELDDLGSQRLKGFAEPLAVWRVASESRADGRFEAMHAAGLTPLVGRDQELWLLLRRWELAKGGEGQVVLLSGEPGIGKSRLVRELRGWLGENLHLRLTYQCSPHHTTSPLHPLIEQLERAAGFTRDDPPAARLDKLETLLARGTGRLDRAVALIAALLGIPTGERYMVPELTPQRQKQLTLEALVNQLEGLAAAQPVLLVYEDVHWIDPTTQELLGLTIERIQHLPVLALITCRPQFSSTWSGQRHVSALPLNRLGWSEGAAMVDHVVGDKALPAEVAAQIVAKTDGVPLFVEELTKAVLESGLLVDAGDRWELSGPLPPLAIPTTLHDSLMARLDRLTPAKEVAQIGAVIGREFAHQLLAAVADRSEAELQAALDQLVASALMFRRGVPPETTYSFKHALVRDAAYGTLLRPHRQRLHAQIATALEERFAETADAHPELLAHHFTEAGETERAVDYWSKAGSRARERSAYAEAIAHLDTGLELLKSLAVSAKRHQRELKLQKDRALALQATRGHSAPEVGEAFAKARQLCRELGDPSEIFPVLRGLHNFHWTRAEHSTALKIGDECLNLAKNQKEGAAEVLAHRLIGQAKFMLGELNAGRKHLQRAIAQYDSSLHGDSSREYGADSKLVARVLLSQLLWVVGYPDRACGEADETLSDAKTQKSKYDLVHTEWQRLFTQFLRRDYHAVLENAKSVSASAREHGVDPFALSTEALNCWARLADSKRNEDIRPFAESIKARRATGAMIRVPILLGSLAESLAANARVKEALATIAEALELTDERWSEAELHRLKGEILLRLDDLDTAKKAEASFRASLDIAQKQGAKSWELRAATSLARLWGDQGRRAEAQDLLAPVYGWFTEGFDTADLKEANGLLDTLA